jgi:hypothetical protein
MDLDYHTGKFVLPPEARRYPSELNRLPSRGREGKVGVRANATFPEIADAINGVTRLEANPPDAPVSQGGKPFALWEKSNGFGFGDFIDIINPLQHIPIVATVYRNFSGDHIGAAPRVIGGALWGRIGGFVAGLANAVVEWWSGKDIGDHIYAALFGAPNKEPSASVVAQNKFPLGGPVNGAAIAAEAKSGDVAPVVPAANPLPASDGAGPNAPRFDILPLPRGARNSYERSRKWGEPDESLGVRFPA